MLAKETYITQSNLAAYCKDGKLRPIEGIREERLHHYRRLVYNITADALESAYPIANNILQDDQWRQILNEFIAEHKAQHAQLYLMPGELIDFAIKKKYADRFDIPFLIDLLKFEWAEVLVHSMTDIEDLETLPIDDLLNNNLKVTPYHSLLVLEFPIQLLNSEDIYDIKEKSYNLVHRENTGTVHYTILNELTYHLIKEFSSTANSLIEILSPLVANMEVTKKQSLLNGAIQFVQKLIDKEIIIGKYPM